MRYLPFSPAHLGEGRSLRANWRHPALNENGLQMQAKSLKRNGAGDEIRTHDIHLGKVALYH